MEEKKSRGNQLRALRALLWTLIKGEPSVAILSRFTCPRWLSPRWMGEELPGVPQLQFFFLQRTTTPSSPPNITFLLSHFLI